MYENLASYLLPSDLQINQTIIFPLSKNINNFYFYLITISDALDNDIFNQFLYPSTFKKGNRTLTDTPSDIEAGLKVYDIIGLGIDSLGYNCNFNVYKIINPTSGYDTNNKINVYGIGKR